MNKRIKIISNTEVEILLDSYSGIVASVASVCNGSQLRVNASSGLCWDKDAQDALIEVTNCLRYTSSFSALEDTSSTLFPGKKCRRKAGRGDIEVCAVTYMNRAGRWCYETAHGVEGFFDSLIIALPLKEPKPKYRPYTTVEMVPFLNKSFSDSRRPGSTYTVSSVAANGIIDGLGKFIYFQDFLDFCKWNVPVTVEVYGEPCGVKLGS